MSDSENDIDHSVSNEDENEQNVLDSNRNSNFSKINNMLDKGRISEVSKNDTQLQPRFTMVERNFSTASNDIIEGQNNNEDSKATEGKDEKSVKNKDESKTVFTNYKIILLGDVSVGKTSIVVRYIDNKFTEHYICTISAENRTKIIKEENESIRLNIWDTVGQEKFRSITRQYFRNSQGAIIVFDITRRETFDNVKSWINELNTYGEKDTSIIVVGNKSDLDEKREVPMKDILNILNDEYLYFEVSARNGNNISMAFDKLIKLMVEKNKNNEENNIIEEQVNDKKEKKSITKKNKGKRNDSKVLKEFKKVDNKKNKKCC